MENSLPESPFNRNRFVYGAMAVLVMLLGMASRRFLGDIAFIKLYLGDMLWALMVFFLFAVVFVNWPTRCLGLLTVLFAFGIEISQLYHAPWIDSIRATRLGGLVLGFTFVWSDFICYLVGAIVGILIDTKIASVRQQDV